MADSTVVSMRRADEAVARIDFEMDSDKAFRELVLSALEDEPFIELRRCGATQTFLLFNTLAEDYEDR